VTLVMYGCCAGIETTLMPGNTPPRGACAIARALE
jgi:hypothetical protein